jgi:hypothetical protein
MNNEQPVPANRVDVMTKLRLVLAPGLFAGVACSYERLRHTIARRYFSERSDFDAQTIISRFCFYGDSRNPERMDTQADSDAFYGGGGGHGVLMMLWPKGILPHH